MGTTFAKTNRRLRNFTRERRRLKQEARKKAGAKPSPDLVDIDC